MKLFMTAFLSLVVMCALSGNQAWAKKKPSHHSKSKASHSHAKKKSAKSASQSHHKKNRRVSSGN